MARPKISIILPVYNEANVLEKSVEEIVAALRSIRGRYEIIIAEDPGNDGTDKVSEKLQKKHKFIRHIRFKERLGRGKSVSEAIKISKGDIAGFIDADLETPANQILPVIEGVEEGYDVSLGVRYFRLNAEGVMRWVASNAYSYLVKRMLRLGVSDTETGCKFFRKKKILPVLDLIEDNHWFWDTEIMFWAKHSGLSIKEVPTIFVRKRTEGSKVNLFRDSFDYFFKLIMFRKKNGSIICEKKRG